MRSAGRSGLTIAVALTALAAPSADSAAGATYALQTLTEPSAAGHPVSGALSDFVVTSSARVLITSSWRRRSAPAGRLSFATRQNGMCRYTVGYRTVSLLAPKGDPVAYVTARLPAATPRHLLDSGRRGDRAYRVVRRPGIGGRVRVDALWAGVLTTRADIAPSGQALWAEIRVSAISGAGDECHSGTWRDALGPTIGDSLAVARAKLKFTRRR